MPDSQSQLAAVKRAAELEVRQLIAAGEPVSGEVIPADPLRIDIVGRSAEQLEARVYYPLERGIAPFFLKLTPNPEAAAVPDIKPHGEEFAADLLARLRREMVAWESAEAGSLEENEAAERFTSVFAALDDHMMHGGALPEDWIQAGTDQPSAVEKIVSDTMDALIAQVSRKLAEIDEIQGLTSSRVRGMQGVVNDLETGIGVRNDQIRALRLENERLLNRLAAQTWRVPSEAELEALGDLPLEGVTEALDQAYATANRLQRERNLPGGVADTDGHAPA